MVTVNRDARHDECWQPLTTHAAFNGRGWLILATVHAQIFRTWTDLLTKTPYYVKSVTKAA